jgi:DNA-binding NarL/FixJ family response regulator
MPISVFLADDHPVVRNGLQLILQAEADIKVVGEAADGREAVRLAGKAAPDVVIMDIAMPGLNGIEATKKICAACPAARVLILSVHATAEHIYQALQAGAQGYLLKESAGEEVIKAVRALRKGQRYLSEKISEAVLNDYLQQRPREKKKSPLESLSEREREILQLTAEGKTSVDIARILFISPKTVETYRSRVMQKLGLSDHSALIKFAIQYGVTTVE